MKLKTEEKKQHFRDRLTIQNLCVGTGEQTEYAKIYNASWSIETLP